MDFVMRKIFHDFQGRLNFAIFEKEIFLFSHPLRNVKSYLKKTNSRLREYRSYSLKWDNFFSLSLHCVMSNNEILFHYVLISKYIEHVRTMPKAHFNVPRNEAEIFLPNIERHPLNSLNLLEDFVVRITSPVSLSVIRLASLRKRWHARSQRRETRKKCLWICLWMSFTVTLYRLC